jgi:hypothetical protein
MLDRPTPTIRRVFVIAILALAATVLAAGAAGARAAFPGAPGPIAVSNSDGIELIDPQSGAPRQLLGRIEDGSSQTAFFPSGEAVAYIGSRLPACAPLPPGPKPCVTEYALFVKSLAESDPDAPGRMVVAWGTLLERSLGVSADGTRIVFAARTPQMPLTGGALELYSVSADGGPITRLTHNRVFDGDPEVSPDGRRIAFVRRVHGLGQIFTMRANGTDVVRLTHGVQAERLILPRRTTDLRPQNHSGGAPPARLEIRFRFDGGTPSATRDEGLSGFGRTPFRPPLGDETTSRRQRRGGTRRPRPRVARRDFIPEERSSGWPR